MHIQFAHIKIDMNGVFNCSRCCEKLSTLKHLQSKVKRFLKNVTMTSSIVDGIHNINFLFIIMQHHIHCWQENILQMNGLLI